jgi:hypothetical protein
MADGLSSLEGGLWQEQISKFIHITNIAQAGACYGRDVRCVIGHIS